MIGHGPVRRRPAAGRFGRRKGHNCARTNRSCGACCRVLRSTSIGRRRPPLPCCSEVHHGARLEIGFGGGEHLVAEAEAHPGTGFIGCEPYVNGMAKILARIEATGIGNIRLFAGDAVALLAWLPPASLSRIDLIHPDPWPKRRHWKRRFVQDATVAALARVLRPGGEFRFVSDIDGYVGWTLAHLVRAPDFIWTAERVDDWRKPWPGYTMTRYGEKAAREGRRAAYLIFRRR